MSESVADANTLVSHTDDHGRTLSGMGADVEKLAETMERHAPPEQKPATPAAEATPPPAEPAQPLSRGRQRFSDLTKERDEAKARADAIEAEKAQLAKERDELRQRLEQAARPREPETPAAQPATADPAQGDDFPEFDEWLALKGNENKTFKRYQIELTNWALQQQASTYQQAARDVFEQERQRYQVDASMRAAQDRGRKTYGDFDTLLKGPAGQVRLGRTQEEANERLDFIATHPASEHIQYAILKDVALAEKLGASDGMTFGMLIAGLVPQAKPQAPAWTPPPAPAPTVGASSPTVSASSADLAKKGGHDFDSSGYREKRAAERGLKTRRW